MAVCVLRLTELKLPITHDDSALKQAILLRLGIAEAELLGYSIAKRSHDARKRSAIVFIYSVDVEVAGGAAAEQALLQRLSKTDKHIGVTPDTSYQLVATASPDFYAAKQAARPIV